MEYSKSKPKEKYFSTPREHAQQIYITDDQQYHQNLQKLYNKPMIYDSNVSNMDQDIETEDVVMNKSLVNSTNPFINEVKNENFNIAESSFSKVKDSRYNTNDPSYISQFNDAFLAVGPEIKEPKTQEIQMDELRKYFEQKIVNAYNSLYMDPDNDANINLTDAEKMIRKIIIKVTETFINILGKE